MALPQKVMNMVYGLGAAVVIIGALFKMQHYPGASIMLSVGLGVEAFIFALSAFEPVHKELDWSLVYPELAGGEPTTKKEAKKESPSEAQGLLSQKLDTLLKEAKIDGELMSSLGSSIKNFESAAKGIAPTVDSIASTKKYSEEMTAAAAQMEALNGLYKVQLDSAERNAAANKDIAENAAKLQQEMATMTKNISQLNSVYGGMLSAMGNRA